jgi:hypothetical protein
MAVAAQYGYNRLVFAAEEQLDAISDIPRRTVAETPMPEALAPIASAIRHQQAGVLALR